MQGILSLAKRGLGWTEYTQVVYIDRIDIIENKFFTKEVIPLAHSINDACINCGACDPTCPVDAISEVGGARQIDADTCIDCGACVDSCPVDAIGPA